MPLSASSLIEVDQTALAAHITRALNSDPGLPIIGAFLFGSALGTCRPDSDIDIGLVPIPGVPTRRWAVEGRAEQLLGTFADHVFDPNLLEAHLFAFEVVTTGQLVYMRDEHAVWNFVERVTRLGWELERRHRTALDTVMNMLRHPE